MIGSTIEKSMAPSHADGIEVVSEIKNIDHLISRYYEKHPDGHFFDPQTLKFFGERRSEMRLLKGTEIITDACGEKHECYVVSTVQRPSPPLKKRRMYHYFDTQTLTDVCT